MMAFGKQYLKSYILFLKNISRYRNRNSVFVFTVIGYLLLMLLSNIKI